MGAGKYNTGAQIAQTIFGINRVQVIAASAVGALIVFGRLPRASSPGRTRSCDLSRDKTRTASAQFPRRKMLLCDLIR